MNLFEIIGPVMVGPSSSHTAGAVKIGNLSRRLMGQDIVSAVIQLHGSFSATGKGHGTDRGLIAGLLGLDCDDENIVNAFDLAKQAGLTFSIDECDLGPDAHPNSVRMELYGNKGKGLEIVAASIGGGRIQVREIDHMRCVFSGDCPTLIAENDDRPGMIAMISELLTDRNINIATIQLDRSSRHGHAVTVMEVDNEIDAKDLLWLRHQAGIIKIIYLSMEENNNVR
ncbi:L-serine ammonia-lyase, iron-sulfur-dependent subunit beta [Catenisphaera adipataccumulans]|jgi:L-serine dehydratase|uniref:L-serine deaminase n=1 Tax=Catenisphaera adipataccumulans TaxID=700500 RepID=A0A7W8D0T7_9FIRM|nr:L-serine ammonia-lyase, iron-sulfur-dependent subunit beta [Catenisphaera adipataccumulans]MBB5183904.1 L-serine dehydratase [Catenisphaera adipataccumulans]